MTQDEQQIINILITVIRDRNLIRFKYNGQIRIVEPYLIGELYSKFENHLEKGKYALRAWFTSGYSNRPIDKTQGDRWRIYELDKMIEIEILSETNKIVRPFYHPDDKDFKRLIFRVNVK
jgi:hypothetical protein